METKYGLKQERAITEKPSLCTKNFASEKTVGGSEPLKIAAVASSKPVSPSDGSLGFWIQNIVRGVPYEAARHIHSRYQPWCQRQNYKQLTILHHAL